MGAGTLVGGRYRLAGRLGADARGRAWRAYDEWLRVEVAVKRVRLPQGAADAAEVRARAVRLAGGAARLRGERHVVTLHDVVVDGAGTWAVTDLVEGRSLAEHLAAHGPLSADRAADVARALLTALDAAYAADVVHGNVKPSNVLLAATGEIFLTDFGPPAPQPDPWPAPDASAGHGQGAPLPWATPGATGPVQDAPWGAPGAAGPAGNAAGPQALPWAGPGAAGHVSGAAQAPDAAAPEPSAAGDLFALGVTLYQAVEGEPPFGPAAEWQAAYGEPVATRRAARLGPLLGALLARDPARRPTARAALALLDVPRDAVPGRAPAASAVAPAPAYGASPRLPGAFVLEADNEVQSLAVSPDGTLLAAAGAGKRLRLWDLTSPHTVAAELAGHRNWVLAVAFSPEGRTLASGGYDRKVRLWDVATGRSTAVLEGHTDWVRAIAFSPDGRVLATGGDDKVIRLWDPATGAATASLAGHHGWIRSLAFAPDGRSVVTGGRIVQRWDLAAGQKPATLAGTESKVRAVAFSPDGRTIAAGTKQRGLYLWDAATHTPLPAWPEAGTGARVNALAFAPGGTALAAAGPGRTVTLRDTATAEQLTSWSAESGTVHALAFTPDGTLLAAADAAKIHLWRVPPASYPA